MSVVTGSSELRSPSTNTIDEERLYGRLVESLRSRSFAYTKDVDGSINCVSPTVMDILGYATEEFITDRGRKFGDQIAKRKKELGFETKQVCLNQQILILEAHHKDGAVRLLEISEFPRQDEGGTFVGCEGIATDITQRKSADLALRPKEKNLREIFDKTSQFIGLMTPEGILLEANKSALVFIGVDEAAVLGKLFWETPWWTHSPELQEQVRAAVCKAVRGEIMRFEVTHSAPDGSLRSFDFAIRPIVDEAGNVSFLIPEGSDITERKQIEAELRQSKGFLQGVLNSITDPVFVKDDQHRFLEVNDALCRLMGRSRGELLGHADGDILPKEVADICLKMDDQVLSSGMSNENEEELTDVQGLRRTISTKRSLYQDPITGEKVLVSVIHDITERKELQGTLEETVLRLSNIIEASPLPLALLDNEGKVTLWNAAAEHLFGWELEEAVGKSFPALFEETEAQFRESLKWVAQGKSVPSLDARLRTRSGGFVDVSFSLASLDSDVAQSSGIILICEDITERRRTEHELVKSNRLLSTLMANLPGMVYRCRNDADRTLEFVSNGCLPLTGYTPEDLIENNWYSFAGTIHELDRQMVLAQLNSAIEQGQPYQLTYRILTVAGDEKWVWEQGACVSGSESGAQILAGLVLDITDSKHEEERRARLTTAVEQVVESIVITAVDGTIEYVNPAFESIYGFTQGEVIGKTAASVWSGKQSKEFYDKLWSTILKGEVWQGRLVNKKKNGEFVEVEATISPVRDANGNIMNFVSVERDVTEMNELEAQLRQAQKLEAVGSLAAGIAHEINTPIQFVGDNTHFLSDAFRDLLKLLQTGISLATSEAAITGDASLGKQFLESVNTADYEFLRQEIPRAIDQTLQGVERIATIVRAMKDFSHPDRREKSTIDVNKALETTLIVARNELKYVAEVKTEFAKDLPLVPAFSGALNQVFLNLLVNAAHAIADVVGEGSKGKGTITVRTRREKDQVVIEISDTGTGITPEIQERIFDPFFTTKVVGKGTGQGLAIARSVVIDKHAGTLTFDTEIGKGTTFYVRLPISPQEVSL